MFHIVHKDFKKLLFKLWSQFFVKFMFFDSNYIMFIILNYHIFGKVSIFKGLVLAIYIEIHNWN